MSKKALLVILDGWGLGQNPQADALASAPTPVFDQLWEEYPHNTLVTFGEEVGLPTGQMGNSEVGHLNIGAGRVVYQSLARINKAIRENTLAQNQTLQDALAYAKKESKAVHLMGLLSDGGVHSHIDHLLALCDICEQEGVPNTYIHAFLDGRDTAPRGGKTYLATLLQHIAGSHCNLASIIGRYYAMDRDNRWDRIQRAYDLLVHANGTSTPDPLQTVQTYYDQDITDEFMEPIVVTDEVGDPYAKIQEGDVVLFFNFRTDRPRQLTQVLSQEDMLAQHMRKLHLHFVTMTRYDESFVGLHPMFTKDNLVHTLGQVLAEANKTQLRIAETEKYAHVTFFFSGGREATFPGEDRIMVPSPAVATYDLQPQMSAAEVARAASDYIRMHQPDFVCLNFANTDMVGHTGDFAAAQQAATTVDTCLGQLLEVALAYDYHTLVIADHGNSDIMINADGSPHTAHTTNLVPIIYVAKEANRYRLQSGKLGDVAPTLLQIMHLPAPPEMTGTPLLQLL